MALNNFFEGNIKTISGKKIILIDYNNLQHRNLFVAHSLSPLQEDFTTWKHLMVQSIQTTLNSFKPDHMIFAIDSKNSWRKEVYPEYKANRKTERKASPIDFSKFFTVATEFTNSMEKILTKIPFVYSENAEADDIIAVLTKHFSSLGKNNIINVSADSDFYQLYKYEGYVQYNPLKKEFVKLLNAERYLETKILIGDKRSDNIPPVVRGVGKVKAEKYIGNLEEMFEKFPGAEENYIRNTILIDFEKIPTDIKKRILEVYTNYPEVQYEARKMFDYLSKYSLAQNIEYMQLFNTNTNNLKFGSELYE